MVAGTQTYIPDVVALRNFRVFQSRDLEYTRSCISEVLQPHVLRPQDRWRSADCYLDHIPVGQSGVGAICFGEMEVQVPAIADYHLFIMCRSGSGEIIVERDSYQVDGRHGLLIAPGEQMTARFSQDCEQLFMRVSMQAVLDHSGLRKLRFRRDLDLANPLLGPWLGLVTTLLSDPATSNLVKEQPRIAMEYDRLLLSFLLAGQPYEDGSRRNHAIAPRSVKRAEQYIHERSADPLTLSSIAAAAGVPTRTLLEGFRRFRDTSPMRYLRDVRLDCAREALRTGEAITAAQAAMDAGLMHLGRFAKDYADRFGEKPSDTLARSGRASALR